MVLSSVAIFTVSTTKRSLLRLTRPRGTAMRGDPLRWLADATPCRMIITSQLSQRSTVDCHTVHNPLSHGIHAKGPFLSSLTSGAAGAPGHVTEGRRHGQVQGGFRGVHQGRGKRRVREIALRLQPHALLGPQRGRSPGHLLDQVEPLEQVEVRDHGVGAARGLPICCHVRAVTCRNGRRCKACEAYKSPLCTAPQAKEAPPCRSNAPHGHPDRRREKHESVHGFSTIKVINNQNSLDESLFCMVIYNHSKVMDNQGENHEERQF